MQMISTLGMSWKEQKADCIPWIVKIRVLVEEWYQQGMFE